MAVVSDSGAVNFAPGAAGQHEPGINIEPRTAPLQLGCNVLSASPAGSGLLAAAPMSSFHRVRLQCSGRC